MILYKIKSIPCRVLFSITFTVVFDLLTGTVTVTGTSI